MFHAIPAIESVTNKYEFLTCSNIGGEYDLECADPKRNLLLSPQLEFPYRRSILLLILKPRQKGIS